ncbi:hypothetical protein F5Y07DRAFT_403291 [Xylaria sp. FL0933]|nr:hypothetical protein F5Y07DRAFT_403291 [Xylaria sp. FL0933]
MYPTRILVTAIVASLPSWVYGQQSEWANNQINTTMCAWRALRAAQLNDTIYMDGGFLYWAPGYVDGSVGYPVQDGNPPGITYTLNLSVPFNSSTNFTKIFGTKTKGGNNIGPNYYDGAMLANNHEFFLYGGLLKNTAALSPPDADDVTAYQASWYGPPKENFLPDFLTSRLPDNMTRYVTYGGAANAPSENKAWYFGGYRSPSWGPIYQPSTIDSLNPTSVSNTFITLDLSKQQSEKWSNVTLPPNIPSRANPSVVWVPVGEQGILVVLGGVLYPDYNNVNVTSSNIAQSEKDSPTYMSNIDIYDVAGNKWYQQSTTGAPPQLAMGCAVVATAQDFSSYNIYYYGGYDGLHETEDFNDDVWVLSLPSFTWTKLYSGSPDHARAGHQCLTPYPDQMITVGGFRPFVGESFNCLASVLQVFNLTEGKWLSSYDPKNWNTYGVPQMIHEKIGGDYAGGATVTTPSPSGWATQGLASVFATKYPASKITPNYPYSSQGPSNGTRGDWDDNKGGGGTPSWVAPVLGVVLGLVFVTVIVVGILLWRRRSLLLKKNGGSDSPAEADYLHRIGKWLNSTNDKAQTITTEDPSTRFDYLDSRNDTPMRSAGVVSPSPAPQMAQHEMSGDQRYFELQDTSRPPELSGEALHFNDIIRRHTQLHSPTSPHSGSPHSVLKAPSFNTGSVSQEQPSSLSSSQAGMPPPSVAAALGGLDRPDSPSLGNIAPTRRTPPPNRDAVVSALSRYSDQHTSHLRNLSGGTVSSTSAPSVSSSPPGINSGFDNGPVSPPLPSPPSAVDEFNDAGDYVSAHQSHSQVGQQAGLSRVPGTTSSLRMSIFRENSEDLGDSPGKAAHNTR